MHDTPTQPPFVQPGDLLTDFLRSFWQRQVDTAEQENPDFRHPPLPLARIKKVMKSDPDVKMIAADAPILFCKACEKITSRAFIVADSNKRRTLSRADIAKALSKSDQFDFLIDIVPREDGFASGSKKHHHSHNSSNAAASASVHATAGSSNSANASGSNNNHAGSSIINGGSGSGSGGVGMVADPTSTGAGNPSSAAAGSGVVTKDEDHDTYIRTGSPEVVDVDEVAESRSSMSSEAAVLDELQTLLNPSQ